MVRKKQKGLVKESLAGGNAASASAGPAAVDVLRVVAEVPLHAPVPFAVETESKKLSNNDELSAWYATLGAASTRFEQLRLLQLFRASIRKLTGAEEGYALFAEATWRLLFRLYGTFDADIQPLQKIFGLMLGDLVLISESSNTPGFDLDTVGREELRGVLETLFQTAQAVGNDPDDLVKVLGHLQTLVEFPFVLKTLVNDNDDGSTTSFLRRTVKFLADKLAVLVAPIAEYQATNADDAVDGNDAEEEDVGASGPTNAVLVASERCSFPLKCIIVLGSLKDSLYSQLTGSVSSFDDASVDFARLLDYCTLILKTRVVHKDLLTQTGLAYCLLLRVLLHGEVAGTEQASSTVTMLFRAVYSETDASIATIGNLTLREHLQNDMGSFGDFGRLAAFRGFLNSLSDDELTHPVARLLASLDQQSQRTVLDYIFTTVQKYCREESLNTRLYAFQVLEAFLRRAVGMTSTTSEIEVISKTTIASLTSAVLLNWENPSKRVNQFMQQLFTHIVSYQVVSGAFDEWKAHAVTKLIQLPQHSRARYGGLSILVTKYDAATLLDERPGLLQSILYAVGIKDVSAASAALFTQVLDELNTTSTRTDEAELAKWRNYWIGDVVTVLLSTDAKLRASVAMYALPLLMKKDPACVGGLIDKLRTQGASGDKDVKLWAVVEVLKLARKKISPEKLLGLSMDEIEQGLENSRPEARGSAFEALCASLKSTNLPTPEEEQLMKKYLVISAKEITASSRMNSLNSLKTVFFRVKEFLRITEKEATKNIRATEEQKLFQAQEIARAKAFQHWLELFIVTSVYPGSLVQRSIVGLEVFLLYVQVFGVPSVEESSLLTTPHMVTCLLNMLIGSWDVIRSLANSILDLYPAALPGFTTDSEMESLWKWALTLCISPRQRESDAGAHFMLLLYRRSNSLVAHNVADLPSALPTGERLEDSRIRLVLKLTDIISSRLASADIARGESPLVHGLLLSLRYIIDGTDFTQLSNRDEWKFALARVFDCVQRSMKLSLAVVGDATSGVGDESLSDTFEGVVGEVSAAGGKTSAIPLRVDCRGHLILEESDKDGEGGNDDADSEQRAVVGSWLAARECGAIVDTIMRRVPLPTSDVSADNLFPAELARQGGEMLLNSLFELKHKGAVATAYEAFEGICKSFLASGEKNPMLGGLPSLWADKLLDRLERSEQQFILRRSSGFAYSFVAILRAEPRNTAAIILPRVMNNLLRLASQDTDALTASATSEVHLLWRSRVHALNILKLISQDAVLADDVAVYVSQMIEYAIFGFECRSWIVRNSSMMLFAAATQRALGDKRIADGASKNKIPSAEVFSRFPQLDGFLFRALERFTETSIDNGGDGVAPPGLFPVLMFLSRLRPTDDDEDEQLRARGSKPLADFVPLVLKCASQSVLPIRQMAALVLGTIVRVDKALPVLEALSLALPSGVRAPAPATAGAKPKSTNYVHGILLQAQSLIDKCITAAAIPGSLNVTAAKQVVAYVTNEFVPKHLWLSTERVKCASIRAVVWEIIESVLQFTAQHADASVPSKLVELVTKTSLVSIDAVAAAASSDSNRTPGDYKSNRAVVGSFFSLLQLNWKSTAKDAAFMTTWFDRVEILLQSPVLEARKRSFKQLAKFLHTSGFDFGKEISIVSRLQTVLLKQLLVETHPTVKKRLLQLLIEIQESEAGNKVPLATTAGAVDTFLELLATSANVDVVGPALQLLAAAVRDGAKSEAVLTALKDNVIARSAEAQPLGLRYSAAVAIERSELLVAHVSQKEGTVEIAVDAWVAALKLLQDDDSHVRDEIRQAVHRALTANVAGFKLDASVSETALLPVAIHYFVKTFSSTSHGVKAITTMLLATIDAPALLAEYTTELSNRIFEAEGNNFYAEGDLIAQLLATSVFEQTSSSLALKTAVLEKAAESLKLLNDHRTHEQWLGGMTYYSSVFPTLYSLLCVGVSAVASLSETERASSVALLSSVQQQATIALTHLQLSHPLIVKAVETLSQDAVELATVKELVFLSPEWAAITNNA